MQSNKLDDVCKVSITTIQRPYAMMKGEELDPALEEQSGVVLQNPMRAIISKPPQSYNLHLSRRLSTRVTNGFGLRFRVW